MNFNVFLNGKVLATYTGSSLSQSNWHFSFNDWDGTRRVQANFDGTAEGTFLTLPFGDNLTETGDPGATEHEFTGKPRDIETGNDYFGARYYNSNFGRFLTPDWAAKIEPVPYAKLDNPQSLNLYSYVGNQPYSLTDVDGHDPADVGCVTNGGSQEGGLRAYSSGCPGSTTDRAQQQGLDEQQTANKPVGSTTVGSLEKTMTHEDGSLSTPKGGDPKELQAGKTALANAIINGAEAPHPPLVATPTVPASAQDAQIMSDAYTNRANGGADPVNGRTFYGTSHTPPDELHSRPIGNGRQTVYESFGPFKDSISSRQTYIYIYNNPGH